MSDGFRRAIVLEAAAGVASAELEDDFHRMSVRIEHDGVVVTHAEAHADRHPWTACPLASGQLGDLLGLPVSTDPTAVYGFTDPRKQCTHLFEMAGLAVLQAARREPRRRYDLFVSDPDEGRVAVELRRDGEPLLGWRLLDGCVVEPAAEAGLLPAKITAASVRGLPDDHAEALLIARRGVRAAAGRMMNVERFATAADLKRPGVCFVFGSPAPDQALRMRGSVRHFNEVSPPLATHS